MNNETNLTSEWKTMDSCPSTPQPVRLMTFEGFELVAIMQCGFLDKDGKDVASWTAVDDNHPECWTDGVCWETNDNNVRSDRPAFWKDI